MLEHLAQFAPYQLVIFALALWLVLALLPQLPVLVRHAAGHADWEVVLFRGALLFLGAAVVIRYLVPVSPWLIVAGWLVLDIAATLNTLYILKRARNGHQR